MNTRREWLLTAAALAAGCRTRGGSPSPSPSTSPSVFPDAGPDVAPDVPLEAEVLEAPYPKTTPKETIADGALALHDWALPGDPKLARRAVVLVPTHLKKGERVPLLLALHGLAETVDETLGAYAWVKKYGIGEGYAHARERPRRSPAPRWGR